MKKGRAHCDECNKTWLSTKNAKYSSCAQHKRAHGGNRKTSEPTREEKCHQLRIHLREGYKCSEFAWYMTMESADVALILTELDKWPEALENKALLDPRS